VLVAWIRHDTSWRLPGTKQRKAELCCLVVQCAHLENDGVKVTGKDDIPYMKWNNWKIKAMFETTNQIEISFALRHRLLISMSPNGHRSCEVYILYTGPMGRS
jgi:hypothetical protein